MKVINYYSLGEKELGVRIHKIREWLFETNDKDQRYPLALLALEVAICARDLVRDDFTNVIITHLT